ncbi:uncharacterized protein LOC132718442, partial [Ruditapes philippinarum]|uniref:uncharacterized protein LOC132718442 n=1 Tax=Ruditapes philippinarum TaxID=129788 RepID=UPI00295BBDD8
MKYQASNAKIIHFYILIITLVLIKQSECRTISIGVLVPFSGARSFGNKLEEVTMELAIKKVKLSSDLANLRKENITFDFAVADTKCDIGTGLFELVEISSKSDAFI